MSDKDVTKKEEITGTEEPAAKETLTGMVNVKLLPLLWWKQTYQSGKRLMLNL